MHFPEVRTCFDDVDRAFVENGRDPLPSQILFPLPGKNAISADAALWDMDRAIASVFAADRGLFALLSRLGIMPSVVAGHSSGEFAALLASGSMELKDESELQRHMKGLTGGVIL